MRNPSENSCYLSMDGVRRGAFRLLPMASFTVPFGVAFGIAAIDAEMNPVQAIALSAFAFSGAAQFAALEYWPSPTALVSIALVVLALNARHLIMGAALSRRVNALPLTQRVMTLALLSDPNFADSQRAFRKGDRDLGVLFGGGIALWCAWVIGTIIGVSGGSVILDPERFGVDVVMACFFVAIFVGHVREEATTLLPVCVAALASLVLLPWLPTGWNVILGALLGAAAGSFKRADE